jgi:hypothetical protein
MQQAGGLRKTVPARSLRKVPWRYNPASGAIEHTIIHGAFRFTLPSWQKMVIQ